jgi:hypothetical protein
MSLTCSVVAMKDGNNEPRILELYLKDSTKKKGYVCCVDIDLVRFLDADTGDQFESHNIKLDLVDETRLKVAQLGAVLKVRRDQATSKQSTGDGTLTSAAAEAASLSQPPTAPRSPSPRRLAASARTAADASGVEDLPDYVDNDDEAASVRAAASVGVKPVSPADAAAAAATVDIVARMLVSVPVVRAFVRYTQAHLSTNNDDIAGLFGFERVVGDGVGSDSESDNERGTSDDVSVPPTPMRAEVSVPRFQIALSGAQLSLFVAARDSVDAIPHGNIDLTSCTVEYTAQYPALIAVRSSAEMRHWLHFEDAEVVEEWMFALRDAM